MSESLRGGEQPLFRVAAVLDGQPGEAVLTDSRRLLWEADDWTQQSKAVNTAQIVRLRTNRDRGAEAKLHLTMADGMVWKLRLETSGMRDELAERLRVQSASLGSSALSPRDSPGPHPASSPLHILAEGRGGSFRGGGSFSGTGSAVPPSSVSTFAGSISPPSVSGGWRSPSSDPNDTMTETEVEDDEGDSIRDSNIAFPTTTATNNNNDDDDDDDDEDAFGDAGRRRQASSATPSSSWGDTNSGGAFLLGSGGGGGGGDSHGSLGAAAGGGGGGGGSSGGGRGLGGAGTVGGLLAAPASASLSSVWQSASATLSGIALHSRVTAGRGLTGWLRYVGSVHFQPSGGEWCGVELDAPSGKNDGATDGVRYFECQPFFGLFVPTSAVRAIKASNPGGRPSVLGARSEWRGFLRVPAPEWVHVGEVCSVCMQHFTQMRRKHHCRQCGWLCCQRCSAARLPLPHYDMPAAARVCDTCVPMAELMAAACGLVVKSHNKLRPVMSPVVVAAQLQAARTLCEHAEAATAGTVALLRRCGGLVLLVFLAGSPIDSIQQHAAEGIARLLGAEHCQADMVAAGVLHLLPKMLLRSASGTTRLHALTALRRLASNEALRWKVAQPAVLDALLGVFAEGALRLRVLAASTLQSLSEDLTVLDTLIQHPNSVRLVLGSMVQAMPEPHIQHLLLGAVSNMTLADPVDVGRLWRINLGMGDALAAVTAELARLYEGGHVHHIRERSLVVLAGLLANLAALRDLPNPRSLASSLTRLALLPDMQELREQTLRGLANLHSRHLDFAVVGRLLISPLQRACDDAVREHALRALCSLRNGRADVLRLLHADDEDGDVVSAGRLARATLRASRARVWTCTMGDLRASVARLVNHPRSPEVAVLARHFLAILGEGVGRGDGNGDGNGGAGGGSSSSSSATQGRVVGHMAAGRLQGSPGAGTGLDLQELLEARRERLASWYDPGLDAMEEHGGEIFSNQRKVINTDKPQKLLVSLDKLRTSEYTRPGCPPRRAGEAEADESKAGDEAANEGEGSGADDAMTMVIGGGTLGELLDRRIASVERTMTVLERILERQGADPRF